MAMPGFTAEASVYISEEQFQKSGNLLFTNDTVVIPAVYCTWLYLPVRGGTLRFRCCASSGRMRCWQR